MIVSGNGTELTPNAVLGWSGEAKVVASARLQGLWDHCSDLLARHRHCFPKQHPEVNFRLRYDSVRAECRCPTKSPVIPATIAGRYRERQARRGSLVFGAGEWAIEMVYRIRPLRTGTVRLVAAPLGSRSPHRDLDRA